MEFIIAKQGKRFQSFKENVNSKTKRCLPPHRRLSLASVTDTICAEDLDNGQNSVVNCFRKGLIKILCGKGSERHGRRFKGRFYDILGLIVDLTMTSSNTASVKILTKNGKFGGVITDVQIFDALISSDLPPTSFGFNLKLDVFDLETGTPLELEINGEDLKIVMLEEEERYGLEITDIEITDRMWSQWTLSEDFEDHGGGHRGEITLTLRLDHTAAKRLYWEGLGKIYYRDKGLCNLKLGGIDTDMVILAGSEKDKEVGIRCHKKILSGCSPVFDAMFQADMSELKDNRVEIVDMTEAGVWAMLQFIYDGDLEKALGKGEIAFELLVVGHKYGMEDLEDAMMQIIWAKPVDWLSVDLTLKMLLFSRKIGGKFEKIEKTSLLILKWYSQKSGSLIKSQEFQRLYLEYPRIALELAESFLKV